MLEKTIKDLTVKDGIKLYVGFTFINALGVAILHPINSRLRVWSKNKQYERELEKMKQKFKEHVTTRE